MTERTEEPPVLTETVGRVLVIRLNRPHVRNAIDRATAVLVGEALDRLDADDELLVGVITGSGPAFCSGADLAGKLRGESPRIPERGFAGIALKSAEKPLIAAVEGYAFGGGFEIALACDLIVASREARFALPEVTRGLLATGGGLLRLADRLTYNVAMRMILTGEPLDAVRAYDLGLVTDLVDAGGALEAALLLAEVIAGNAPLSVRASKRVVAESRDWPAAQTFEHQWPIVDPIAESDDAREGMAAFVEKRTPNWTGT